MSILNVYSFLHPQSIGIDMSDEDMDSIVVKLDKDGDGDIDYR